MGAFHPNKCHWSEWKALVFPIFQQTMVLDLGANLMNAKKDKHRLTPHQRRVVEAKIRRPEASLREIGTRAGYTHSPRQHAYAALRTPHVQTRLAELMEKHPRQELKFERLLHTLADGLGATEIKVFQDKGRIIESPPYVDHDARHA